MNTLKNVDIEIDGEKFKSCVSEERIILPGYKRVYLFKIIATETIQPFDMFKNVKLLGIESEFYYADKNTLIEVNTRKTPILY